MPCEFQNCERVIGRAQALGDRSRYSSVPTGGEQDDADEAARSVTLRLRSPAAQVSADHALSQTFTNKHQVVLGTRSSSLPLSFIPSILQGLQVGLLPSRGFKVALRT